VRSAALGGSASPEPFHQQAVVEAIVVSHYQIPQTKTWYMKVRLEGGKVVDDIRPLSQSNGKYSSHRSRLPRIGSYGLVAFPQNDRNPWRGYWMGGTDAYIFGVHTADATLEERVDPSGMGEARHEETKQTLQLASGDRLLFGSGEMTPHVFQIRRPLTDKKQHKPQNLPDAFVHGKYLKGNAYMHFDALENGGFWGFSLRDPEAPPRIEDSFDDEGNPVKYTRPVKAGEVRGHLWMRAKRIGAKLYPDTPEEADNTVEHSSLHVTDGDTYLNKGHHLTVRQQRYEEYRWKVGGIEGWWIQNRDVLASTHFHSTHRKVAGGELWHERTLNIAPQTDFEELHWIVDGAEGWVNHNVRAFQGARRDEGYVAGETIYRSFDVSSRFLRDELMLKKVPKTLWEMTDKQVLLRRDEAKLTLSEDSAKLEHPSSVLLGPNNHEAVALAEKTKTALDNLNSTLNAVIGYCYELNALKLGGYSVTILTPATVDSVASSIVKATK